MIAVGHELRPGWTEKQAAGLIGTYLRDCGVKAFFHEPYAWFGPRSRFDGISRRRYHEFNPSDRELKENDVAILDVAPILDGYIGDIGYPVCLGNMPEFTRAISFLKSLRKLIPGLVQKNLKNGAAVWQYIDDVIKKNNYDNIHQIYPFNVLGHRVKRVPLANLALKTPLRFSLHSFYQILSGGLFPEILSKDHHGDMTGLWAIEPHIGWDGYGVKFEEILVVEKSGDVFWLEKEAPWI